MLDSILPANVGSTDRLVRILIGIALLTLTVAGPRSAWGYLGLIPLLTGLVGRCPLYAVLGISTTARRRTS
jgi:hypothetical protein